MRSLTDTRLVKESAPAGLAVGILCAPLILYETSHPILLCLQLITLPLLSALLVQAALAWTPEKIVLLRQMTQESGQRLWLELLTLAGFFTIFRWSADPVVRRLFVVLPITTWAEFIRKLPFAVLAQPLLLIIGVYTFAYRLSNRHQIAMAAIILVHQSIVILQFATSLDLAPLAAIALIAGIDGFVGALAYTRYGITGPLVVYLFAYARHAAYLVLD